MSEQEHVATDEEKDDVEAHKKKQAVEDPQAEDQDEDFEAHKKR